MYFEPDLYRAFNAGQELAAIILQGKMMDNIPEVLDKAFFIAGTLNASLLPQVTINTDQSLVELAGKLMVEDATIQAVDLSLLWLLAKRVICSL